MISSVPGICMFSDQLREFRSTGDYTPAALAHHVEVQLPVELLLIGGQRGHLVINSRHENTSVRVDQRVEQRDQVTHCLVTVQPVKRKSSNNLNRLIYSFKYLQNLLIERIFNRTCIYTVLVTYTVPPIPLWRSAEAH